MDRIDAFVRSITNDEIQRIPSADRRRLALALRQVAGRLDAEPAAPQRALEALGALSMSDFRDMCPLDRANFAARCRRWAHIAELRRDFHNGGAGSP